MTIKTARQTLAAIGLSLRHTDGEFRVAFHGRTVDTEPSAYYTNDIDDALATGQTMARQRDLARMDQGFMKPRVWADNVWTIEGDNGTTNVEASIIEVPSDDDITHNGVDAKHFPLFRDYYDGREIHSVTYRPLVWCAQLSAPGYMDQTDMSVFDTRAEAEQHLIDTYGDDDESETV